MFAGEFFRIEEFNDVILLDYCLAAICNKQNKWCVVDGKIKPLLSLHQHVRLKL